MSEGSFHVFDLKDSKSGLCFDIDNVIYLIYQFEAFNKAISSNCYLGLNPVLPVLVYFFFLISRFVTLYGFYQIKYIHTYICFHHTTFTTANLT